MENKTVFNLVVIGGGLAGLTAANRAAEDGLKVCVLEQSAEEAYLCATRYTGGMFHIAMDDMLGEAGWVRGNIDTAMHGETIPDLADTLVQNAPRTLAWLKKNGVKFISAGPDGLRRNALAPPGVRQTGLNWRGRAGDVLLRTLAARLAQRGGVFMRGVRAQQLTMEEGRCVGLSGTRNGAPFSMRSGAVVIADGGFQSNRELVRRFISPAPERLLQRNAQSGMGDGLMMAEAVGAKLTGVNRFYGHIQAREAMTDPALWPYPVLDTLACSSIVVDRSGQRFCDEGHGGVYVTNEIARLHDPLSTVIIFDAAIWAGPGKEWLVPANPFLLSAGGKITQADSIAALADKMGIDGAGLEQTVAAHNAFVAGTPLPAGMPSRSTHLLKPWPIVKGPFLAVEICAGMTYTMGGIETDGKARVLNTSGEPIPGLFAAGATTGGLEGGSFAGYSGGLSKSSVFGLIAGESVSASLLQ
jgi:fumarate reductase flavoprotein subunit